MRLKIEVDPDMFFYLQILSSIDLKSFTTNQNASIHMGYSILRVKAIDLMSLSLSSI